MLTIKKSPGYSNTNLVAIITTVFKRYLLNNQDVHISPV